MTASEDLNKSLDDMREKTKTLNDSLKALVEQGLDGLTKAVNQSASTQRGSAARGTDAGTVVTQELSTLLGKELTEGIAALFGGGKTSSLAGAASGGGRDGGISVVINNNTSASVTATQTTDSFDRKSLEIAIDQMVASALTQGTETTGILRSLFGLVPSLIGR